MNNIKSIIFKLSYNQTLRKIAKKLFVYFPTLKSKLMDLRDNSYIKTTKENPKYQEGFLNSIKKEIEKKRGLNFSRTNIHPYAKKYKYVSSSFKAEDASLNYDKSLEFKKYHLSSLQFVFISIDKHNLEGTIKSIDKYMNFVKEYIIITQPKLVTRFKKIKSIHKIIIIDENKILGKYKENFKKRDHQSKNWLLRASLLNLDILEDEFIMLDDDNRPLKNIYLDKFIDKDSRYNAYYFYNLLDWYHYTTDYDKGQQNTKEILTKRNYELLSYSSHAPQIINKKIFQEVVDEFFDLGLSRAIDEWTIYFSYAISKYPSSFNKKVYETLAWPANPANWDMMYIPQEYSFENYYKELYDIKFFKKTDTVEEKIEIYKKELKPYLQTAEIFRQNISILSAKNMIHKTMQFKTKNIEFYLSNVPYFVMVKSNSDIKLKLNYKLLNDKQQKLDMAVVIYLDGNYRTLRELSAINNSMCQEGILELPITSKNLVENVYDITFNLIINNRYIYKNTSPYLMKLVILDKMKAKDLIQYDIIQNE